MFQTKVVRVKEDRPMVTLTLILGSKSFQGQHNFFKTYLLTPEMENMEVFTFK